MTVILRKNCCTLQYFGRNRRLVNSLELFMKNTALRPFIKHECTLTFLLEKKRHEVQFFFNYELSEFNHLSYEFLDYFDTHFRSMLFSSAVDGTVDNSNGAAV